MPQNLVCCTSDLFPDFSPSCCNQTIACFPALFLSSLVHLPHWSYNHAAKINEWINKCIWPYLFLPYSLFWHLLPSGEKKGLGSLHNKDMVTLHLQLYLFYLYPPPYHSHNTNAAPTTKNFLLDLFIKHRLLWFSLNMLICFSLSLSLFNLASLYSSFKIQSKCYLYWVTFSDSPGSY